MTITQELQFSVLSAPVAQTDRRALSQAWFSALYSAKKSSGETRSTKAVAGEKAKTASREPSSDKCRPQRTTELRALTPRRGSPRVAISAERRAPRLPLTKKIETFAQRVHRQPAAATFVLDAKHGRVGILIRTDGSRVRLTAICSERSKKAVASALTQAAYALAPHGLRLEAETRDAAC